MEIDDTVFVTHDNVQVLYLDPDGKSCEKNKSSYMKANWEFDRTVNDSEDEM